MKRKGYRKVKDAIIIERELTRLDLFVRDFLEILTRHSDYLIVSGYVSIMSGRVRGTEDVDIIAPILDKNKFDRLFNDLEKNDFWCYQGDTAEEVYPYLEKKINIRFAKKNELFPNIEFIAFDKSKKAKLFEFNNPQKVKIEDFEFKVPPIEFEILYKELILKGKKDIEDARHLRTFFSDIINYERFKEYEPIIKSELK